MILMPFMLLVAVLLGAWINRAFFPILPDSLEPEMAAKILHSSRGFAGYSLINSDASGTNTLGHVVFCPTCATEIAMVDVKFLAPQEPRPGSRMAILMDLARAAPLAVASTPKKLRKPTEVEPVVAVASVK